MANVLVVDDHSDTCETVATFLSRKGHSVSCATNGKDALSEIIDHKPDLVVLDLLMPEMDGPSLLEVLRSYLRFNALPVVVWTGLPDGLMIDRARQANVNSILVKSKATLDDLGKAVEQELHRLPT